MRGAIVLMLASGCADIAGVRDLRAPLVTDAGDAATDVDAACPPGVCAPALVGNFPDNGQALLAADGARVFVGTVGGQILAAPVSGGAFESLYVTPLVGLAVDADDLFSSAGTQITVCPKKDCGLPAVIADTTQAPMDLAVAGDVYFLAGSRIQRVARTGGKPIDVLLERPVDWTADVTGVTFSRASGIFRCAPDGCAAPVHVADASAGGAVATSGAEVYWIDGTLLRKSDGSSPAVTLATIGVDASSIVVGPTRVYWREGTQRVAACPRAGGAPATVASRDDAPATDLASDATAIYWMTNDRRILRYVK